MVLAPGDALYLPRGWLHSAQAQEASSLHLTVGIRALTRYALVEELLALAAEDQRLRASLPFGIDVADPDAIEPELTETVEALRDWLLRADPARGGRPAAPAGLAGGPPGADPAAGPGRRAGRARRRHPGRPARGPALAAGAARVGPVALRLFDRTITLPGHCEPALAPCSAAR